ncbi:MAG: RagB/SusD family nutrient uptake outer membrane protein [Bacteroidales bacterium]|nr:RagB/SusD family nutrient uptake outer membrane protein [Bacteroidales bacterium]
MKVPYLFICTAAIALAAASCDVMDLQPKDRVSSELILSTEDGVRTWMANLYYDAPFQDFGYNRLGPHQALTNTVGIHPDMQTDNAVNSEYNHLIDAGGNFGGSGGGYDWWSARYRNIRDINLLLSLLPGISALSDEQKEEIAAEAHFLRAWDYFDLAKHHGGVPIIDEYQQMTEDPMDLRVPRSTEADTWDFVLREFDLAISGLPGSRSGASSRRATKWAAYGLKSRAALYAASVAKFWSRAPLEGQARAQDLVGLESSAAARYYRACIEACEAIISSGQFSLWKAEPDTPSEAADNILAYFQNPAAAPQESMLLFGYEKPGAGSSIDFWYGPWQTRDGGPHPGRMNPTLDLADAYEVYSDPGKSAPIITTEDGDWSDYNGYNASKRYLHFSDPTQIFADKDARMWAAFVLPYTQWKGKTIRIQAGYIKPDGTAVIEADKASVNVGGVTYHTFGAASSDDYSGFDQSNLSCMTRTGFCFKKFLSPTEVSGNSELGYSLQDWAELRYAEILLNYAEAVVESGLGDASLAAKCLNATRRRAAFKTDIPLTSANVQRERRVEFAFECKRHDDLRRRREFHTVFNNTVAKSLDPVLDLRTDPPQYIFVRKNAIRAIALSWPERYYYDPIPGIASNGLVQNPQF